jgi:hypothetical protein
MLFISHDLPMVRRDGIASSRTPAIDEMADDNVLLPVYGEKMAAR